MRIGRYLLSGLFIAGGIGHFIATRHYERAMPDYLPAHRALVLVSGVAEIAGGLGVLFPHTRRLAAWGLVLLLIAVFPANIWMVQHPERFPNIPLWALWLRLPLQIPLILWAWNSTRELEKSEDAASPNL